MLDLFCGRWGASKAFAARGWECIGIDLVEPPEIPDNCIFIEADLLGMWLDSECRIRICPDWMPLRFDFAWASTPCEEFSVWGMKHFHPHPKYPESGIKLFNHTRAILEASGVPFVMENVRAAQQFVGNAVHHCGPFYLWGNAVPPLMPGNIGKGTIFGKPRTFRRLHDPYFLTGSNRKSRDELQAKVATIPPELASCVADYAERLLEAKSGGAQIAEAL